MLFEAAFVATSAAVSSVAEAFALHEIAVLVVISGDTLETGATEPVTIGAAGVDPAALPTLRGMTLLEQLALLPGDKLADFMSSNAELITTFLSAQPSAREVSQWWSTTSIDSRSTFLSEAPAFVGNLEGVPFGQRDYANRRTLAELSATTGEAPAGGGRAQAIDAGSEQHMLEQIRDALVSPKGAPARYLLSLDPDGAGTASIVIGDLENADYVSFLVPGMFYTVDSQIVGWTTAAQTLYDTQQQWVHEFGVRSGSVATVAWLGYETPSMVNFTSLDLAYEGRDAIAASVNGLRELRGDDQPFLSLVAHSYGSTAAMMALTDFGIQVDALAVIGSPGSAAQSASDLGVKGDNVFVGEADWDQVKDSAFFGSDPGSDSFGAHLFRVAGGVDPITGAPLLGSTGHDEYLVPGSESIRNIALVTLGRGYLVTSATEGAAVARPFAGIRQP